MKKTAMPAEDRPPVSAAWREALRAVRRRPAPPRRGRGTRRAYGFDLAAVRPVGDRAGPRAGRGHHRASCAATPPRCPSAATCAGHRRAQARGAARVLPHAARARPRRRRTPPTSSPPPSARATLPTRPQGPTRSPRCWTASRPRRRSSVRDRALFELAYACGLRAEELVDLDVGLGGLRRRGGARRGQGRRRPASCPAGEAALRAVARYLERARPALRDRAAPRTALFLSKSGRRLSTSDVRRRLRVWARHAAVARRRLTRTRCATRSRPTCSTAAPTCAPSRSCSATHRSPRPRSTLG